MGWFGLGGRRKPAAAARPAAKQEPTLPNVRERMRQDGPRQHHYTFAHKLLPAHLWNGDSLIGVLVNVENQSLLPSFWNKLGEQLPPAERLAPTGLRHSTHWIGGEHLAIAIEFPPVERSVEARFAAILTSPDVRYFTAERSVDLGGGPREANVLCEWDQTAHLNFGPTAGTTLDDFLRGVCRLLNIPETVEAPAGEQLLGLSRGGAKGDLPVPPDMSPEDEARAATWDAAAKAAADAGRFDDALGPLRSILDLRMSRQGLENAKATIAHAPVAAMLIAAGRYAEAEAVCRPWWALCRRHRMVGHAETLLALRLLADCIAGQGKPSEAVALMTYRAQIAGLARGAKSPQATSAKDDLAEFQARYSPDQNVAG